MAFVGCKEIRMYVSGPKALVLTGALTQLGHPAALRAAEDAIEPLDAQLVVLAEANPATSVAPQFLGGQARGDRLVVVPWDLAGDGIAAVDPVDAEKFTDRIGTQIQLPAGRVQPPPEQIEQGRFVPVDAQGRETSWSSQAAMRVLPWSHVAARAAVRAGLDLATGPVPPSPARLARFLTELGWLDGRLPARAPAVAQLAAALLARYGVPPTFDTTSLTASPMPVTEDDLHALAGGTSAPADAVRTLLALTGHKGATALVSYLPGPTMPRRLALVRSDEDGLWWFDPAEGGPPARYVPATDRIRTAYLQDAATRVLLKDLVGRVTTPEDLLARSAPPAPPVVEPPAVPPVVELPAALLFPAPPIQVFMADVDTPATVPVPAPATVPMPAPAMVSLPAEQRGEVPAQLGLPAPTLAPTLEWLGPVLDRVQAASAAELPSVAELHEAFNEFAASVLPFTTDRPARELIRLASFGRSGGYPLPVLIHLLDLAAAQPTRPAADDHAGWQVLLEGLDDEMPRGLRDASTTPDAVAAAADLMLARWWAARSGVPAGQIRQGLLGPNPVDLLALHTTAQQTGTEPRQLFEQRHPPDRVAPADLATALHVGERLLAPVRRLLDEHTADAAALAARIQRDLQPVGIVLRGLADTAHALTFLTERGLTVDDLADDARLHTEAIHWLADTLGISFDLASALAAEPWFATNHLARHLQQLAISRGLADDEIRATARELGVNVMWVAAFSLRTGRVPTNLPEMAGRWGVTSPARLFRLVAELGVDPDELDRAWADEAAQATATVPALLNDPADDRAAVARAVAMTIAAGRPAAPHQSPLVGHLSAAILAGRPPEAPLADTPATVPEDADLARTAAQVHDQLVLVRAELGRRTDALARGYSTVAAAYRDRGQTITRLAGLRTREAETGALRDRHDGLVAAWAADLPDLDGAVAEARWAAAEAAETVRRTQTAIRTNTTDADAARAELPGLRAAVTGPAEATESGTQAVESGTQAVESGTQAVESGTQAVESAAATEPDRAPLTDAQRLLAEAEKALDGLVRQGRKLQTELPDQEAEAVRLAGEQATAEGAAADTRAKVAAGNGRLQALSRELSDLAAEIQTGAAAEQLHAGSVTTALTGLAAARAESDAQRALVDGWEQRRDRQADLTDLGAEHAVVPVASEIVLTPATVAAVEGLAMTTLEGYWADHPGVPQEEREQIEQEVRDRATMSNLTRDHEFSTIATRSGKAYVLGDGVNAVRATLHVRLRRPTTEPAGRPVTELQGQLREQHAAGSTTQYTAWNNRDIPLSLSALAGLGEKKFGLGKIGQARSLTPNVRSTAVWNQFSRSMSVSDMTVQSFMLRLREPHYPHPYEATWTWKFAPATSGLVPRPATSGPAPKSAGARTSPPLTTDDLVILSYPEHIARPKAPITDLPGTDEQRRDGLAEERLVILDGLHDPGTIELELRRRIPALDNMDAESQRALLTLLEQSEQKGGLSRLRHSGLLSGLLHDRSGRPLGYLRLRSRPIPRRKLTEAPGTRMETYRTNQAGLAGSTELRNAVDLGAGMGANIVAADLPTTSVYGNYNIGSPSAQAILATGKTQAMESGGPAALLKGWESSVDAAGVMYANELDETDLEFTATLLDMTTPQPVTWIGRAADGEGAWVRRMPLRLGDPDPGLHPPADIEHGNTGSIGHSEMANLTMTEPAGRPGVDEQVLRKLRDEGFVAMGGRATEKQMANYGEFLRVTEEEQRESDWAELDGYGMWTTFERNNKYSGKVDRISVRWQTRPVPDSPAVHEGASRTGKIFAGSESSTALTSSETVTGTATVRGQLDITGGTGQSSRLHAVVGSVGPVQADRSYDRLTSRGPVFDNQTIIESAVGDVHAFQVRRQLNAEMYRAGSNQPFWTSNRDPDGDRANEPDLTARAWVPDILVHRGEPAPPPAQNAPREVTPDDRNRLARRADQQFGTISAATGVAGSPALNRLFQELAQTVFGNPKLSALATVTAPSPAARASGSGAARRAFLSPAALLSHKDAFLSGAYVTEQQHEMGEASQSHAALQLQAYLADRPRYVPPRDGGAQPVGYFEHSAGVTEGLSAGENLRRVVRADGTIQFVLAAGETTVSVPFGGRGARGWSRGKSGSQNTSDERTFTYEGPFHTVAIPLTFVGRLVGGFHSLGTSLVELIADLSETAELAVDVHDAIEAHLTFDELVDLWRALGAIGDWEPRIWDLPDELEHRLDTAAAVAAADDARRLAHEVPTDADVRFLPRRIAARLGLGEGLVIKVKETGRPVEPSGTPRQSREVANDVARALGVLPPAGSGDAEPPGTVFELGAAGEPAGEPAGQSAEESAAALLGEHRALFSAGLAAAERTIKGVTRPGSRTYAGVVWSTIADVTKPDVVNTEMIRYFSSGISDSPVRLISRAFKSTKDLGGIRGRVEVYARPTPGFESFDDTRKIFGRVPNAEQGEAGIETHAVLGEGHGSSAGRSAAGGAATGATVLAPDRSDDVRWEAVGASVRGNSSTDRSKNEGDSTGNRHTTRNSGQHVVFPVPVQLAVRVVFEPSDNLINAIGPKVRQMFDAPADHTREWVDTHAKVLVPEPDTSPAPVRMENPDWYRPARSGAGEATLRDGLDLQPYTTAPRHDRLSFFNGQDELARLARQVLFGIANAGGAADIDAFFAGMTGEINTHRLLSSTGPAEREFTAGNATSLTEYSGTIRVEPIAATPWQPSTDQMDGDGERFVVGAGGRTILERFKVRAAQRAEGRGASQNLIGNANYGTNFWAKQNQIDPALKNAPGNISTVAANWLSPTAQGGEPLQASAADSVSGHRGTRMPGLHNGAANTPNVLANRIVLFRVTGVNKSRLRGATEWTTDAAPTRYLLGTVEDRISLTDLPPTFGVPPAPAPPAPAPATGAPATVVRVQMAYVPQTGPQLNALVPVEPAAVRSTAATVGRRFLRWRDTHPDELRSAGVADLTVVDLLTSLRTIVEGLRNGANMRAEAYRTLVIELLHTYDQLGAQLDGTGVRSHPVRSLVDGTEAYRWLAHEGLSWGSAERIAFDLFLDVPGARRFVALAQVLGTSPAGLIDEVVEQAEELGLIHPEQLYAVSRDLALAPAMVVAAVGDLLPGLGRDATVAELRKKLAEAGVRINEDLIALIQLSDRIGPADPVEFRAALGRLRGQGVSPALLNLLPDDLVERALRASEQHLGPTPDVIAERVGLAGPGAVRAAAEQLGIRPADLLFLTRDNPMFTGLTTPELLPEHEDAGPLTKRQESDRLRQRVAAQGRKFGQEVYQRLTEAGVGAPGLWLHASAVLGFGVHEMLASVPRDSVTRHVADLLGDVRSGGVDVVLDTLVPAARQASDAAPPAYEDRPAGRPERIAYLAGLAEAGPSIAGPSSAGPSSAGPNTAGEVAARLGMAPADLVMFREVFPRNAAMPPAQRAGLDQLAAAVQAFLGAETAGDVAGQLRLFGRGRGPGGYTLGQIQRLRAQPFEDDAIANFRTHRDRAKTVAGDILRHAGEERPESVWPQHAEAVNTVLNFARNVDRVANGLEKSLRDATGASRFVARNAVNLADRLANRPPRRPTGLFGLRTPRPAPELSWDPLFYELDRLDALNGNASQDDVITTFGAGLRLAADALRQAAESATPAQQRYADRIADRLVEIVTELSDALTHWQMAGQGPVLSAWDRHAATVLGADASVGDAAGEADLVLAHWWLSKLKVIRLPGGGSPAALLTDLTGGGHRYVSFLRYAVEHDLSPERVKLINEVAHGLGVLADARLLVQVAPDLVTGRFKAEQATAQIGRALNRLSLPDADSSRRLMFLADSGIRVDTRNQAALAPEANQWSAGALGIDSGRLSGLRGRSWEGEWAALVESLRAYQESREPGAGWDVVALDQLAARLGVSSFALRGHSVLTERVPADLGRAAAEAGIEDPARLFALAVRLKVDHRELAGQLRRPEVRAALNGGQSRSAAVQRAVGVVDRVGLPARRWLADLSDLALRNGGVPADLVALAERAGLTPSTLAQATHLLSAAPGASRSAGPADIVAFVESKPAVATAGLGEAQLSDLGPAQLADRFRAWADQLAGYGIPIHDIGTINERLRPIGRTLGTVENAVDAAEAIDLADGVGYGSSAEELTTALHSATQRTRDNQGLLILVQRIADVQALAGHSTAPIVGQRPPTSATLTVEVPLQRGHELQTQLAHTRDVRFSAATDPAGMMVRVGLQHGWPSLTSVLRNLRPGDVLGDAQLTVPSRFPGRRGTEVAIEGLDAMTTIEVLALILAVASPESVRTRAMQALGREPVATAHGVLRLAAPTGAFRPQADLFDAFPDLSAFAAAYPVSTRAIAMMAAVTTSRRVNPPRGWWTDRARRDWHPIDVATVAPGDGLASVVLDSARRQNRAIPDAVSDPATLMAYVVQQIGVRPTAFAGLNDHTAGSLYVGMLDDATAVQLAGVASVQLPGAPAPDLQLISEPAGARTELARLIDGRNMSVLQELRTGGRVADPDLAAMLTSLTTLGPLSVVDFINLVLRLPNLRRWLPPTLVEMLIGAALDINLTVLPGGAGGTVRESRSNRSRTLVVAAGPPGTADGYRAYGPPTPQATIVAMAQRPAPAWEFVAETMLTPAEMLQVARGIRSDMREGYGRTLQTRLEGKAEGLEAVRHLPVAASRMEATLADPDPALRTPAIVLEQFHNLLRTLEQTHLAVAAALPDAAGELPTVQSVVRTWAQPPVDPAALKPGQAAWTRGRLTMIGTPESWSSDDELATTIADLAAPAGRPLVVIRGERLTQLATGADAPASAAEVTGNAELRALTGMLSRYDEPARDAAELTTLGTLLSGLGAPPVVVTTGESPALTTLLRRQGIVQIVRVPSLLGEAWQVMAPGRTEPVATADRLSADLFAKAADVAQDAAKPAPAVLAGWLAQPTWADAGEYLADNLDALRQPEIKDALAGLRVADPDNRELAAYQVVLHAAVRAGGLGDPAAPGWRPPVTSNALGADGMADPPPAGPVPPWFLLEFLSPLASYNLRRGWNDSLLQLLYSGQLTGLEVVALTRALIAPDGTPSKVDHGLTNLKVFHTVATVLAMTPEQAATAWPEGPFQMAQALLQTCTITPTDRWLWVLRLANLRDWLAAVGMPGRFGPAAAGEHSALLNGLATSLSNCF